MISLASLLKVSRSCAIAKAKNFFFSFIQMCFNLAGLCLHNGAVLNHQVIYISNILFFYNGENIEI